VPAEEVEEVQSALNSAEWALINKLKKDMSYYKASFKVKPILNCIDKINDTKYIAHFGYSNSLTNTKKIPVGPLNRFYPNPANRGQPTVFAKGTWNNKALVTFNGSLLIWGLDGNVAYATKSSKLCSKPPPKCPISCDDKNPCTADLCSASTGFKCVHKPLANGVSCSDGNACNGEEVCKGVVCKPGKPPVCQDGNSCTDNTCDPKMGCVFVPKPDGTQCPVSGNCGAGGACKAGQCTPNSPSCDDNNPCTADACGGAPACSLAITQNVYNGPAWWGTITFKNNGSSSVSSYKVEFDIPVGKNCTADYVPPGATLSPLTGSGSSAKTVSNHCIFTWASAPLAAGASRTFNYSTNTQSFTAASNVTASCLGGGCTHTPVPAGTTCSDGDFCNGAEVCNDTGQCKASSIPDCNDGNPCTVDSCQAAGGCGHVPGNNGGECTTAAGTPGKCEEGICQPGNNCPDDGNACTDEVIDPVTGACTHPPKTDDTPCNDGNLCTQSDVCKSGVCTGTVPVVCAGATACRSAGTCNPGTGLCQGGSPINEGGSCDDNNLCTNGDKCAAGQCVGAPVVCVGDQCHDAGTCDPATGLCFNPNKPNGTTCSDGLACTGPDTCTDGACEGDPVVCQASDSCHEAGVCVEETGGCTNPPSPDGKACSDSNACTQTDACNGGVCTGGNPVTCPGETQCTNAATCNPASGLCLNGTPKMDGTQCNDNLNCTSADACSAGVCTGMAKVCSASDQCHEAGTCVEATGACTNPASPDGKQCNDSVNCTTNDRCASGVCGGSAVVCPPPADACHLQGTCQEATGQCSTPNAPDGTSCSDGLNCTTGDRCTSGACGGAPVVCGSPPACRLAGVCQEGTGQCTFAEAPNGTACSDGNFCTQTDTCVSGACTGSNPVVCAAETQCTEAGVCNPASGACSNIKPKPPGTTCDDGLRCTSGDVCNAGNCGGTPLVCGTGLTCNEGTGTCDQLGACDACLQQHVVTGDCQARLGCADVTSGAADVALCTTLRDCMLTTGCWATDPLKCLCGTASEADCLDSQLANGACKAEVLAAVKTTDMAEAVALFYDFAVPAAHATQEMACAYGFCSENSSPPSTACPVVFCPDDGNPCTQEKVVNGVCTHPPAPDGVACNDNNACTQTDACSAGVCTGSNPVECGGASGCQLAGTCDPASGLCLGGGNKPNGSSCDDAKNCTTGDVCTDGVCGGSPVTCPAPTNTCQVAGTCVEATGLCSPPTNAPDGTTCSDGLTCTEPDQCTNGVCGGAPKVCPVDQVCSEPAGCAPTACGQCRQENIDNGNCDGTKMGCDKLADPTDRALCETLLTCMRTTNCWLEDPSKCLCGTAQDTACLTGANGVCKDEVFAATKAANGTDAGTRFYDNAFPSGFATQLIACEFGFCTPVADPPSDACP
jgi:hypothetical protein